MVQRSQLTTLIVTAAVVALLVSACAGRRDPYHGGDRPPVSSPDPSTLIEMTPRVEPLSATGNSPYRINGRLYVPMSSAGGYSERGVASWYGRKFHGRRTSSGETFDMYKITAAHPLLPLPTYVRVSHLENGRSIVVKVNDRGPFLHNRLIDLSYGAALKLGIAAPGTGLVQVDAIDPRAAPAASRSADPAPTKSVHMYVQAGAYAKRANAENMARRLREAGLGPVRISVSHDRATALHRVRVGPVSDIAELDTASRRVALLVDNPQTVVE